MTDAETVPQQDGDTLLPIEEFVTYRLLALTSRLNRQGVQILQETCGLRLPEWRCLAMMGRHGALHLHRISEIIGMDRAQVTRSVQGLISKGMVETERDGEDARTVRAALTEAGRTVFTETFPIMEKRQRDLLAALSPSDRKAFYRIMDRLSESVAAWETRRNQHETG